MTAARRLRSPATRPLDAARAGEEAGHKRSKEAIEMARKYVDCREMPSESNCTVAIAADSEDEVIEAAVQHAVAVHSHEDNAELRDGIRQSLKEMEGAVV
jgi:predicted small metal-binding protein